jgi:Alginate lyase
VRRTLSWLVAVVAVAATGAVATTAHAAPAVFTHPGVLVSRAQLDFVKTKVNAGAQPWKAAYDQMVAHSLSSQSRNPSPRAVVQCGYISNPNLGCTEERQDALAAYANALRWYITGDSRYAKKAISIMDAWSGVIKSHTDFNARLQTGWAGSSWPRAAEIIRYTYTGWAQASIDRFSTMLRTVYLPVLLQGSPSSTGSTGVDGSNGNWELTMLEAAVGISVFLNDRASYDKAVAMYRARVKAYLYLTSDGAVPVPPTPSDIDTPAEIVHFWHDQSTFVNGVSQETCRDFVHAGYGLAAIAHVAETTRIQGQDLYPEIADRLGAALEFHARYELGTAAPSWLCGGTIKRGLGPATEVGVNALTTRMGRSLPNARKLTTQKRPAQTNILFIGWDTLTHADNPN